MAGVLRGRWVEAICWIGFAALAFIYSFKFDRDIEIYRFGAAGWPRVLIVLIVLAALAQLFLGQREQQASSGPAVEPEDSTETSLQDRLRIALVLGLPVLYAALLDTSGFYFTTPIFIAAYLFLNGERRIGWLIGVPAFIYGILLLVFTKLLYVGLPIGYASPFYEFSNWLLVLIK